MKASKRHYCTGRQSLSDREREVLKLIGDGAYNKEIADFLQHARYLEKKLPWKVYVGMYFHYYA